MHALESGKEKTHKHNQIWGIVPGRGGCQKFVYVFLFCSGHSLYYIWGSKKHIKRKSPQKSRDNPLKILFMCFFLYVFSPPMEASNALNYRVWGIPAVLLRGLSGVIRANRKFE